MNNMMRLSVVGTNSGCGKTTTVLAIESVLLKRNLPITAFKCGPDYIDGAFHRRIQNIDCYNLDSIFLNDEELIDHFVKHAKDKFSIIEGVMGMFDGVGDDSKGSSFEISKILKTPTVLVINARGMGSSVRAILRGFNEYSNNTLGGVIFTNISSMAYSLLEKSCDLEGIKCFGYLPYNEEVVLHSRHLGLVGSSEIKTLNHKIETLSNLAEEYIKLDELIELANSADVLESSIKEDESKKTDSLNLRIAIASDDAFCFTYQENLDLLVDMGLELVYFSPLKDAHLPPNISALYLPGGYPELHLKQLEANSVLLKEIRLKIRLNLPTIAECGGFLYLHKCVDNKNLVSLFNESCKKESRLQHFGYGSLESTTDNLLFKKGESTLVHEFHYYSSTDEGDSCIETKLSSKRQYKCCKTSPTLYAGFPHLYFLSNPKMVERLIKAMIEYKIEKSNG